MPKNFSPEEKVRLIELAMADDIRFEYITSLRVFSSFGHGCREPFSLLPIDVPAPVLDDDLDAEAERRALELLLLQYMQSDYVDRVPKDIFSKAIELDGKTIPTTMDFVARCVWWLAVHMACAKEKPAEWYAQMGDYLRDYWPLYDGGPVTEDTVSDWVLWREIQIRKRSMPKTPIGRMAHELHRLWEHITMRVECIWLHFRYGLRLRK